MKYLIMAADYTGIFLQDNFDGFINLLTLGLPDDFIKKINMWNDSYKRIIPMGLEERQECIHEIDLLDAQGLELTKQLAQLVLGGAKIRYFSEGRLEYLNDF